MAFLETPRFPDKIALGAIVGPEYASDIVVVESGWEQRNQVWSQALHRYDVGQVAKRAADYADLQDFWHAVAGPANGFRFKDWTDYQVTAAQGVWDTIDSTHFQLVKLYTAGALTRRRTITKPVSGTVAWSGISLSGVTLDYTTGIATVTTGTLQNWSGEFDVPCRFDIDQMRGRIITPTRNGEDILVEWGEIPIREIRI